MHGPAATPEFLENATKALQALEGKMLVPKLRYHDPFLDLDLRHYTDTGKYLEEVTVAVLAEVAGSTECVKREPLGPRTFPDIGVTIGRTLHTFEIKSWQTDHRGWAAASVPKFNAAIDADDLKYFTTNYVDFNVKRMGDGRTKIDRVLVGHIWDFATGLNVEGKHINANAEGCSAGEFAYNVTVGEAVARAEASLCFLDSATYRRVKKLMGDQDFSVGDALWRKQARRVSRSLRQANPTLEAAI